jgi:hypothetical protein
MPQAASILAELVLVKLYVKVLKNTPGARRAFKDIIKIGKHGMLGIVFAGLLPELMLFRIRQ